jgi:hypothetical protein
LVIDSIADAAGAALGGQAVPDDVLNRWVVARLDASDHRIVPDRPPLHEDDPRMLAALRPGPETAEFVHRSIAEFTADVAPLLSVPGEHGEAERLVRQFLARYALDERACRFLTAFLMERGLVRLGARSWHAERLARRKSLAGRLRMLHENARTARLLLQTLGVGGTGDLLEQEDLLEHGLVRLGGFDVATPGGRGAVPVGAPRLDGRSVLVLNDEGLGDRVWRARYLPWLGGEMGGRVVVEAGPQLARLLRRTPGVAATVEEAPPGPTTDFRILPTGLQVLFDETHEAPPTAPYIFADPAAVLRWRPYVAGGRFTVGLNWAGDPAGAVGRDVPLAAFAPLARAPGIRWIGLQKCLSIQGGWTRPRRGWSWCGSARNSRTTPTRPPWWRSSTS